MKKRKNKKLQIFPAHFAFLCPRNSEGINKKDFLKEFSVECKKKYPKTYRDIFFKEIEIKIGKCMFYRLVFVEENFSRKQCRKGDIYDCVICIRKNVDYV